MLRFTKNVVSGVNAAPSAPTSLNSSVINKAAQVSWTSATDAETPQNGLSYNLSIGTTSSLLDVMPAMSDAGSGYRRIPSAGNVNNNTLWDLKGLPIGVYYWAVQTVDQGFKSSSFAQGDSFLVAAPTPSAQPTNLNLGLAEGGAWL